MRKRNKRLDFLPNIHNKYSIRKFTVGTASILLGTTLIFGASRDAEAAEENGSQQATEPAENSANQTAAPAEQNTKAVTAEAKPEQSSTEKNQKFHNLEQQLKQAKRLVRHKL
ncbi:MSCRAMM family adhesin SdrC [Staphylococcus sp. IVB6181]|nr:MSCRAMM family adhesin SdrC [Staphylococcus sp. IVB6181]UXV35248.1 MSCRAMM family adhesin SdrC [Staphylococcus sp. IVB6181]